MVATAKRLDVAPALSGQDVRNAEQRMYKRLDTAAWVVAAHVDAAAHCLHICLNSGVELSVPCSLLQGLENAERGDLDELEISPTGLGLHFPRVDADIYVPALLQGVLGDSGWMARQLGSKGGRAVSAAKSAAARANGKLGGRPRLNKLESPPAGT